MHHDGGRAESQELGEQFLKELDKAQIGATPPNFLPPALAIWSRYCRACLALALFPGRRSLQVVSNCCRVIQAAEDRR